MVTTTAFSPPRFGLELTLVVMLTAGRALGAPSEIDLFVELAEGSIQDVTTVVEVRGDLTINADGQKLHRLPLEAKAQLRYAEKFLAANEGAAEIRTIRHYAGAETQFVIKNSPMRQTLRPERRLIVADYGEASKLYSPSGPLTREELDLIDVPGSSACLDMILPGKRVAIGGTWKLSDAALSRLLAIEVIAQHDVTGWLTKVEDGLAIIDLKGHVTGAVGGVSTELEVQGKVNYHVERKAISWLALQYDEKRAIGHAQPGYEATVRVRVQIEPSTTAPEVDDATLARVVRSQTHTAQSLIEFKAEKAGIEFRHDRRWRVMVDRFDTVILRLVDRGDLIAQCNITRLPSLAKGEQLSLAAFQNEVEQTLGKNLGQILESKQFETSGKLRVLRVAVAGTAAELPIEWLYYHISSANGYRGSLVFTMESKLVERFNQLDRELIETMALSASLLDETREPQPAAKGEAKSARRSKANSSAK